MIGGIGSGHWRKKPRWYRIVSRLSYVVDRFWQRPVIAGRIVWQRRMLMGNWCPQHWWQRIWPYSKAVFCVLFLPIDYSYPHHWELWKKKMRSTIAADSLATWNHNSWLGPEFQHYNWSEVAVCLGWRYWHAHVYEADCP